MKSHYKVKLSPNPQIIRVVEGQPDEIIFDKYLPVKKAESLCLQLNSGMRIDFDNLN